MGAVIPKYKQKSEFDSVAAYYDYLATLSPCGNSAKLIAARMRRIGSGYSVHSAVTTPRITKPLKSHPYRSGSLQFSSRSKG